MRRKIFTMTLLAIGFINSFAQADTIFAKLVDSDDFRKTISKHLVYPEIALENSIYGKVVLKFRINKKGCVDSMIVIESPDLTLSRATITALNKIRCDWTPAKINNMPVDSWLSFHTTFSFEKGQKLKGEFDTLEDAIKDPLKVRFLILRNSELTEIPKEVFSFPNLFTLNLENNRITDIPKEIQNSKKLNFLLLKGNNIKTLPDEILSLRKIYKIDLSDNGLTFAPKIAFYIKNLQQLDLSKNQLTEIPSDIENLKKLRFLYLADNKIEKLPEAVLKMTKLYRIDLQGNRFSDSEKDLIRKRLPKTEILF